MHRIFDKYGPQPWRECGPECVEAIGLHVHTVWTAGTLENETPEERVEKTDGVRAGIRILNQDIEVLSLSPLDPYAATPYPDTPDRYVQPWRLITIPRASSGLQSEGVVS